MRYAPPRAPCITGHSAGRARWIAHRGEFGGERSFKKLRMSAGGASLGSTVWAILARGPVLKLSTLRPTIKSPGVTVYSEAREGRTGDLAGDDTAKSRACDSCVVSLVSFLPSSTCGRSPASTPWSSSESTQVGLLKTRCTAVTGEIGCDRRRAPSATGDDDVAVRFAMPPGHAQGRPSRAGQPRQLQPHDGLSAARTRLNLAGESSAVVAAPPFRADITTASAVEDDGSSQWKTPERGSANAASVVAGTPGAHAMAGSARVGSGPRAWWAGSVQHTHTRCTAFLRCTTAQPRCRECG
jgi:hypothetical protein